MSKRGRYSRVFTCAALTMVAADVTTVAAARPPACDSDGRTIVAVDFRPPDAKTIAGVKVHLDYPKRSVAIPGSGNDDEVKARVADVPKGFLMEANDLDDALIVAIAGTAQLPTGRLFTVELDHCKGATAVDAKEFHCTVEEASTDDGVLVGGSTCTVTMVRKSKEKSK